MNITPLGAIWLTVCINSFIPILGFFAAGGIGAGFRLLRPLGFSE